MSTISTANAEPGERRWLTVLVVCLHALIILYVMLGWLGHTRLGLLVYLLVLPLIAMQWLFNRGHSITNSAEALYRTGNWRDAPNPYGVNPGQAGVHFAVSVAMAPLWIEAFYRMILIPTNLA